MSVPVVQPTRAAAGAAEREAVARRFETEAFSPETRRKYAAAWLEFEGYCRETGESSLPASIDTVRQHLSMMALDYSVSKIAIAQAAIMLVHARAGHAFDDDARARLHVTTRGIRRTKAVARKRRAPPLDAPAFAKLLAKVAADMAGLRDRALVGLGFDFFLRRSELSQLDVEDLAFSPEGLRLTLRRSKTLKGGRTLTLSRPRRAERAACPVAWVEDWIEAAGGLPEIRLRGTYCRPLFRAIDRFGRVLETRLSGEAIRLVVRDRARAAGLDRTVDFSAHSMRAGGLTAALDGGLDIGTAADQANHATVDTTRIYDRRKADAVGKRVAEANATAFYPERAPEPSAAPMRVSPLGPATGVARAADELARTLEETERFTRRPKPGDGDVP